MASARLRHFSLLHRFGYRLQSTTTAESVVAPPRRLDRTKEAILQTLSSTVGRDPTGPDYQFIDDPFLIPSYEHLKRDFALAKESGKRTAQFIIERHPAAFWPFPGSEAWQSTDPPVPSFDPKPPAPSEPSEDNLLLLLDQRLPLTAFGMYERLERKLSSPTRQRLLEELAFSNSKDHEPAEYRQARRYAYAQQQQRQSALTDTDKRWQTNGPAEQVFADLQSDQRDDLRSLTRAYTAIVCGMARHAQAERATALFEEMKEKGVEARPWEAFDAIMQCVYELAEGAEARWEQCSRLLEAMRDEGVAPTLQLFNSTLEQLARMSAWPGCRERSLSVLAEMNALGIEPSLASYTFVLEAFYRSRSYRHPALMSDVLHRVAGTDLSKEVRDRRDRRFLPVAMELCHSPLHNAELAQFLHERIYLAYPDHRRLLVDMTDEQRYYEHQLMTHLDSCVDLDAFFADHYDRIVPLHYSPTRNCFRSLVQACQSDSDRGLAHLPRLWSDALVFNLAVHQHTIEAFLDALIEVPVDDLSSSLRESFLHVASSMFEMFRKALQRVQEEEEKAREREEQKMISGSGDAPPRRHAQRERRVLEAFTAPSLSALAVLLERFSDDGREARELLRLYAENRRANWVKGLADDEHLGELGRQWIIERLAKSNDPIEIDELVGATRAVGELCDENEYSHVREEIERHVNSTPLADAVRRQLKAAFAPGPLSH